MLNENILFFLIKFLVNVLLINIKRLSFKLNEKKATNFNKNVDNYYIHDSLDTLNNRDEKTFEDVKTRDTTSSDKKKKKEKDLI